MPADRYAFLLDAQPRKQIQIAKLGDYSDPRYGDFSITADEVAAWAANLSKLPGGRAPIDFDHAADKPGAARNTEAAGWITNVALADGVPVADVEWTPDGEQAIKSKRYLFFSPSYGPWQDETGATTPDVLQGGALTNKPFLNMPTVCLAKADVFATETDPEPIAGAADSRPSMPTISPKILEAFGLGEDADEAKVLSAITELKAEPKSLDAQAAEAGKVLLSREDHDKLKGDADKAGALAVRLDKVEAERADEKFEAAYGAALKDGKVDAKDDTKAEWRELYDAIPDATVKRLAALPKVVNTTAQGTGGSESQGEVPKGVDPAAFELDQRVQEHIRSLAAEGKTVTYMQALDAVREA